MSGPETGDAGERTPAEAPSVEPLVPALLRVGVVMVLLGAPAALAMGRARGGEGWLGAGAAVVLALGVHVAAAMVAGAGATSATPSPQRVLAATAVRMLLFVGAAVGLILGVDESVRTASVLLMLGLHGVGLAVESVTAWVRSRPVAGRPTK